MSEMYGFGSEEEEQGEPQTQGEPDPKGFRKWMGEVSETLKELRAENDRLKAEQTKQAIRDTLTAQGYAPQVADLYAGKPEGLNDWLSANGALFVKANAEDEQQQAQQGQPATTVSPEDQAAQAAFAAAGQGAAGAATSTEEQLVARLKAATSLQELEAIEREQGSRYV